MTKFTTEIGFKGHAKPRRSGVAAAVDYLRVAGHLVFGYLFARMAQVSLRAIAAGSTDPFYTAKLQTARFYFASCSPDRHPDAHRPRGQQGADGHRTRLWPKQRLALASPCKRSLLK